MRIAGRLHLAPGCAAVARPLAILLVPFLLALAEVLCAAPAIGQECLYYANQLDGTVSYLDPAGLGPGALPPIGTIPLTQCPSPQGCRPVSLAFSPARASELRSA